MKKNEYLNALKSLPKNPFAWIYLLGLLLVYWTQQAVLVGIKYDLVSFAQPMKRLNDYTRSFQAGRMDFWTVAGHWWELLILPILLILLCVAAVVGVWWFVKKRYPQVWKKIFKTMISIKLAVLVILAIASLSAWGTFVESKYADAVAAGKQVYHSWWMYGTLLVLSVQLIAVMVDRWPWKMRHAGFILAHIGILVTIYGSILTRYFGIDGSMAIPVGQKSKYVIMPFTDLKVLSTFDGERYSQIYYEKVDFYSNPPTAEDPHSFSLGGKPVKIIDYMPYSIREAKLIESEDIKDRAAVRYQLVGSRANVAKWIQLNRRTPSISQPFGPMNVTLSESPHAQFGKSNELLFYPIDRERMGYKVYSSRLKRVINEGEAKVGDLFGLGFMDFEVRIINYFKDSTEKVTYREMKHKSELTSEAVKVVYNGKEQWTGSNSLLRFFEEDKMYILTYGNTYMPIDVEIELLKFNVGRYQGTNRAATYASDVRVKGLGEINISMNEPLKHQDFYFYQASFQEDERGNPTASILSVNNDPGRFLKYLGSLLITIGSLWLFYMKRVVMRKKAVAS